MGASNVGRVALCGVLFVLQGCATDTRGMDPGPSAAARSTSPSGGSSPAQTAAPTASPTFEAFEGSQSTEAVRPDLNPDERTLYMTRGGLPSPLIAKTEVPKTAAMTAEIYCQGAGSFRLETSLDSADSPSLAPMPEIPCGDSPDGGFASVALGEVEAGTSVAFTFAGTAGVQFLVRVQLDRAISSS